MIVESAYTDTHKENILFKDASGNRIILLSEVPKKYIKEFPFDLFAFKGKNNTVFLHGKNSFKKALMRFDGNDNILVLPDILSIEESDVTFVGNDSLCYINLSGSKRLRLAHIVLGSECVFYYGKGTNVNLSDYPTHFYTYESSNIIIGNKCLIGNDVIVRTCDNHLFYDLKSGTRINLPGSVFIGDNCWICQSVYINKNTVIGSGTIVGARSVIGGKVYPSNTLVAGQPGKVLREDIAILGKNNRCYVKEDIEKSKFLENSASFLHIIDKNTIDIKQFDSDLKERRTAQKKLEYIEETLLVNDSKNRFAVKKQ